MKANAMQYEYLIRRAHQCSRFEVAGASADTFRRLEECYTKYSQTKNEEAFAYYMLKLGEVSAYIKTAIHTVKKKYLPKLNDAQYQQLEEIEMELSYPDIKKLNDAILKAEKIFLEIGLFPA